MIENVINHWYNDFSFWQTAVLVLSAAITMWIYYARKNGEIKNAAKILMLQIKNIEKNIDYIRNECVEGTSINEKPLHYSKLIFDENYWIKYNHLFVAKLDSTSYKCVDDFFRTAEEMKWQQQYVKDFIRLSLNNKANHYYNSYFQFLNKNIDKNFNLSQESVLYSSLGADKKNAEGTNSTMNKDPLSTSQIQSEVESVKKAVYQYYDNFSISTYIPLECGSGLRKAITTYETLTGKLAFQKIEKLAR